MSTLLVAVDGSASSLHAVQYVIDRTQRDGALTIHVLNVQAPLSDYGAFSVRGLEAVLEAKLVPLQQQAGERALQPARAMLDAAGLAYTPHVLIGPVAETIAAQATQLGCDGMVLGTRGMDALSTLVLGSVAMKVLHHASVPVTLVK